MEQSHQEENPVKHTRKWLICYGEYNSKWSLGTNHAILSATELTEAVVEEFCKEHGSAIHNTNNYGIFITNIIPLEG